VKRLAIFAATSGHSGVDRNLKNLIPAIAEQGVQVDLLHVENHGPHLTAPPPGVRVVELGSAHVNTSLFPLLRYLRQECPDAILSDKDKVNRLTLWARRLARVPTKVGVRLGITISRNLTSRNALQRRIQLTSMRYFYPWADAIIVPSRGVAEDMARLTGLPLARIQVLPNPVVTPRLDALARERPPHPWLREKTVPVILGSGELSARKDFATLLRAYAQLRRRRPCRLIILGRGRQKERLLSLARELGVEQDFALPGFVDNPYAWMHRADLFVLSSRLEGFGNVLAEALAMGTPVVSTDCPSGPEEILEGGRHGPLVPIGDHAALADAMENVLNSPPAPHRLQAAVQPYRSDISATRYLQALGLGSPDA